MTAMTTSHRSVVAALVLLMATSAVAETLTTENAWRVRYGQFGWGGITSTNGWRQVQPQPEHDMGDEFAFSLSENLHALAFMADAFCTDNNCDYMDRAIEIAQYMLAHTDECRHNPGFLHCINVQHPHSYATDHNPDAPISYYHQASRNTFDASMGGGSGEFATAPGWSRYLNANDKYRHEPLIDGFICSAMMRHALLIKKGTRFQARLSDANFIASRCEVIMEHHLAEWGGPSRAAPPAFPNCDGDKPMFCQRRRDNTGWDSSGRPQNHHLLALYALAQIDEYDSTTDHAWMIEEHLDNWLSLDPATLCGWPQSGSAPTAPCMELVSNSYRFEYNPNDSGFFYENWHFPYDYVPLAYFHKRKLDVGYASGSSLTQTDIDRFRNTFTKIMKKSGTGFAALVDGNGNMDNNGRWYAGGMAAPFFYEWDDGLGGPGGNENMKDIAFSIMQNESPGVPERFLLGWAGWLWMENGSAEPDEPEATACPDCEGFAKDAVGGRGGMLIVVTNTEDDVAIATSDDWCEPGGSRGGTAPYFDDPSHGCNNNSASQLAVSDASACLSDCGPSGNQACYCLSGPRGSFRRALALTEARTHRNNTLNNGHRTVIAGSSGGLVKLQGELECRDCANFTLLGQSFPAGLMVAGHHVWIANAVVPRGEIQMHHFAATLAGLGGSRTEYNFGGAPTSCPSISNGGCNSTVNIGNNADISHLMLTNTAWMHGYDASFDPKSLKDSTIQNSFMGAAQLPVGACTNRDVCRTDSDCAGADTCDHGQWHRWGGVQAALYRLADDVLSYRNFYGHAMHRNPKVDSTDGGGVISVVNDMSYCGEKTVDQDMGDNNPSAWIAWQTDDSTGLPAILQGNIRKTHFMTCTDYAAADRGDIGTCGFAYETDPSDPDNTCEVGEPCITGTFEMYVEDVRFTETNRCELVQNSTGDRAEQSCKTTADCNGHACEATASTIWTTDDVDTVWNDRGQAGGVGGSDDCFDQSDGGMGITETDDFLGATDEWDIGDVYTNMSLEGFRDVGPNWNAAQGAVENPSVRVYLEYLENHTGQPFVIPWGCDRNTTGQDCPDYYDHNNTDVFTKSTALGNDANWNHLELFDPTITADIPAGAKPMLPGLCENGTTECMCNTGAEEFTDGGADGECTNTTECTSTCRIRTLRAGWDPGLLQWVDTAGAPQTIADCNSEAADCNNDTDNDGLADNWELDYVGHLGLDSTALNSSLPAQFTDPDLDPAGHYTLVETMWWGYMGKLDAPGTLPVTEDPSLDGGTIEGGTITYYLRNRADDTYRLGAIAKSRPGCKFKQKRELECRTTPHVLTPGPRGSLDLGELAYASRNPP